MRKIVHTSSGSDNATMAPPDPTVTVPPLRIAVRMTILRSLSPFSPMKPMAPEYIPLGLFSISSIMFIVRNLGAPA